MHCQPRPLPRSHCSHRQSLLMLRAWLWVTACRRRQSTSSLLHMVYLRWTRFPAVSGLSSCPWVALSGPTLTVGCRWHESLSHICVHTKKRTSGANLDGTLGQTHCHCMQLCINSRRSFLFQAMNRWVPTEHFVIASFCPRQGCRFQGD